MDLLACFAGTFAIAIFGWFGNAKSDATANQQTTPGKDTFPQSIEVIPGKLRVKIFLHDVINGEETIPCWSYVTDGLAAHHQKEVIFTVRREKSQKPEDYPHGLLELFAIIYHLAEKGQLVDVGQSSLFNEAGFQGDKDFRGLGYVEPQGFPGVETGSAPLLAAILLKRDEAQIAWELGLTRVTALLGMKYRFYPYPRWSDLRREPVAFLQEMNKSILGQIASVGVRARYYEERNHIFLLISPSGRTHLQRFLGQLALTKPMAIRTEPDARANACLVWRPGQSQQMAITPERSDGSRKTGAFLAFVPEQEVNEVRSAEDGFFFLLTNGDWQKIREALISGSDVSIPPSGQDGAGISIEWESPKGYTSPVTGETYFAENWTTYQSEGTPPALKQRLAISVNRIVLLTGERELAARTTAKDLADYVNGIEDVADAYFASQEQRIKREVRFQLELDPEAHRVRFVAEPDLSAEMNRDLTDRLEIVPAPKVRGSVKLELILNVWGFASKQ